MAGPGVALRLHEFRERQDFSQVSGAAQFTLKLSRHGRDVRGLYPSQLGRVHVVHSKDSGVRFPAVDQPLRSPNHQCENYQRGFDFYTFQTLNIISHSPAVQEQRPPETAYQEEFGLQTVLFHQ